MLRKQKEEERKEKLKRDNPIAWHKENVAAMGDCSEELQAYVQQHFDQQRTLLNCKGQKKSCGTGCEYMENNQHVLS